MQPCGAAGARRGLNVRATLRPQVLLIHNSAAADIAQLPAVKAALARSQTESKVASYLDMFASYEGEISTMEEVRTLAAAGLLDVDDSAQPGSQSASREY
jgi:hypothetical protein